MRYGTKANREDVVVGRTYLCEIVPFFFYDQKKRAYIQVGDSFLFLASARSCRERSVAIAVAGPFAAGGSLRRGSEKNIKHNNKTKNLKKKPNQIEREREMINNTLTRKL